MRFLLRVLTRHASAVGMRLLKKRYTTISSTSGIIISSMVHSLILPFNFGITDMHAVANEWLSAT